MVVKMKQLKNSAFQYAKVASKYFNKVEIVCNLDELTLDEAKQLWNKYYEDCAKWLNDGNTADMVIWIDMDSRGSYGKTLESISTDAISDGVTIWENRKYVFPKTFNLED